MRPPKERYFLDMLKMVAARSTCCRRQVGAIIVDVDGHVLSMGYNGVPQGVAHCTDWPCPGAKDPAGDTARCWAVHAEQNALLQCADLNRAHTMYVSCTPCFVCAKMIANTPIRRIVCSQEYADQQGKELFTERGIACVILADDDV